MSGAAAGQVIVVAVTPILTRLYDPSVFGTFGVFLSVVAIITSFCTLRFEQALMLPHTLEDAAGLLALSCFSAAAIALLAAGVCIPARGQIAALMDSPPLAEFIWLVPVAVFLSGLLLGIKAWAVRHKQFHLAARSQVLQSATASGFQCAAGTFQGGPLGLMAGFLLGQLVAFVSLVAQLTKRNAIPAVNCVGFARVKRLVREYADFPLYGSTQCLLNSFSQNFAVLLLAHFFGTSVVGFYAVGIRVLQLPRRLVIPSLEQVVYQRAAEVQRSDGNLSSLFNKLTLGLLAVSIIPAAILVAFAPAVFSFVLGSEWRTAGEYTRWLVIWSAVAFANLPSTVFTRIYRKQRSMLLLETTSLILRAGTIIVGGLYLTPLQTIIIFSIVGAAYNGFFIIWIWRVVGSREAKTIRAAVLGASSTDAGASVDA
jgi:lipopolysaccharide exporter